MLAFDKTDEIILRERLIRIVCQQNELEAANQVDEEFEEKGRSTEDELRQLQDKVRDNDQIVADSSVKEDVYERKVKRKISVLFSSSKFGFFTYTHFVKPKTNC